MVRAAILISLVFAVGVLEAALPAHTVSPTREFVIYGGDATLRGNVSELAEQTKMNFLALLRQRDQWKTAVIINLLPQQANLPEIPPTDLRVTQTGFGVKFQLDLIVGEKIDSTSIERQLLRATLLEMFYRGKDDLAAGTTLVQPPDWLVEGCAGAGSGTRPRGFGRSRFNLGQRKIAGRISGPAFRPSRFRRTHALPSLFVWAGAGAPGRGWRANGSGAVHRQSIACVERSGCRFEGLLFANARGA